MAERPRASIRRPPSAAGVATATLLKEAVRRHQAGDLDTAAAGYERVLSDNGRHPDALHLLGLIRHQRGDHQRARALIERALAVVGDNAAYRNSLGAVLLALGRPAEAETVLRGAIDLDPNAADAHTTLGRALMARGRAAEAVRCFERALALRPDYAEAHGNLGSAYLRAGRLEEARQALEEAVTRAPGSPSALANLGLLRTQEARYEDALALYDRALAIHPQHATARANRAVLLLLLGRYEEGWREYEWRWRVDGFSTRQGRFASVPWTGAVHPDATVFIHAEQGLGSAIQFVRYASLVAARCREVVVECEAPLERLFRQSLAADLGERARVVVRCPSPPPADAHAAMMSLPHLCGTTLTTVPARVPYLTAATSDVARWRARLAAAARPRIGLVWAGNPRHLNDRNRSMPAAALARLTGLANGALFSLQVGGADGSGIDAFGGAVKDLAPALGDFAETAAAIEALDLVISVDTAVAHLAGALGRPVWLLLPFVPEWRWLLDRADTPWYPSMRLFRQRAPGDWAGVVEQVIAAFAGEPR